MTKVTVISAYYNRESLLERTVRSILEQTYEDFELLIVDDNSTDNTPLKLSELFEELKDDRFRFAVNSNNKGFVRGMIDAIDSTDSEYIAVQGSGDVSLPERLAHQVDYLDRNPHVGLVGGWAYRILDETGESRLDKVLLKHPTLDDLLQGNLFPHGAVMFRRSVYEAVGGYNSDFVYAQDYDLWLRIAQESKLAILQEPLYELYSLLDGVSSSPHKSVQQYLYSQVARKLATAPTGDRDSLVQLLAREGPTGVLPVSTRTVQKFVYQKALRWTLWTPENAKRLVQDYGTNPLKRAFARFLIDVFWSSPCTRLRNFVLRRRGYASTHNQTTRAATNGDTPLLS